MDFLVINKSVDPPKVSRSSSGSVHELTKKLEESGITDFALYTNVSDSTLSDLFSKITQLESRISELESLSLDEEGPATFRIDDPSETFKQTNQEIDIRNSRIVNIKLVKKELISSDPDNGVFEPKLLFSIDVSNLTSKAIRAVKGDLVFSDLFGADVFRVSATINQKIKPKGIARWDGEMVYNEFIPENVHFGGFNKGDLTLRLENDSIVYA